MENEYTHEPTATGSLPLMAAVDIQDNLMTASHDLDRLQILLEEACDALMLGFQGATLHVRSFVENAPRPTASSAPPGGSSEVAEPHSLDDQGAAAQSAADLYDGVLHHLSGAITALQFQDMACQLIAHTHKRLRNCADRIAREAMGDDEDGMAIVEEPPLRPNPVTQDEMDAGSVELF